MLLRPANRAPVAATPASIIAGRRRREDFARPVRLQRADDAGIFHALEQSRRAVVADLEAALHVGDRGLALAGDDLHRLVVQRVLLAVTARLAGRRRLAGD